MVAAGVREKRGLRAPTAGDEHPVDRVFGSLRLDKPVNDLLDELRGPRARRKR
jgi:hypothetical protein